MRRVPIAIAVVLALMPDARAADCTESTALGASNAAVTTGANLPSVGFVLAAGTLAGTLTPEASLDNGVTWVAASFVAPSTDVASLTEAFTNPNAATSRTVVLPAGATHARVRVSTYSAGTANGVLCVSAAPNVLVSREYARDLVAARSGLATATTLTEIVAAPAAGVSLYLTDVAMSSSAAATTTTDEQLVLKYGTGTNCGTGTTLLWACFNAANAGCVANFKTPIKLPAANALCWIGAASGSKYVQVQGYRAP